VSQWIDARADDELVCGAKIMWIGKETAKEDEHVAGAGTVDEVASGWGTFIVPRNDEVFAAFAFVGPGKAYIDGEGGSVDGGAGEGALKEIVKGSSRASWR
jgi:hypothetical protein